jgi:integrase
MLPKRYATYSAGDEQVMSRLNKAVPVDSERERRLADEEEQRIRAVLEGQIPEGRARSLTLPHRAALALLFDLALETAMRLREMFTLEWSQIDLPKRTIFLDKTKNGDKRQVPLSSVAVSKIKHHLSMVKKTTAARTDIKGSRVFPWWEGERDSPSLRKTTARLSRQFARVFEAAGCADLRFHDLRHEATSRLYERTQLSDLEIAKISGHKHLRMLRRYANLRGSALAHKLW